MNSNKYTHNFDHWNNDDWDNLDNNNSDKEEKIIQHDLDFYMKTFNIYQI
jgi:hypothetical protein